MAASKPSKKRALEILDGLDKALAAVQASVGGLRADVAEMREMLEPPPAEGEQVSLTDNTNGGADG